MSARGSRRPPRLGFLGLGWIGRHRMEAVARSGVAEVAALADPSPEMLAAALGTAPGAGTAAGLAELVELDLDGLVIATPSALHAEQAVTALEHGLAVFCQKPLGRDAAETRRVVETARAADSLVGVDFCYRNTEALRAVRRLAAAGDLGDVYAVDLVFHNAYGPDKDWFYDRARSGGGCLIDLGIHLVDAALWLLGFPPIEGVSARILAGGRPLAAASRQVEDYAVARLDTHGGAVVQLACSWRLPAGRDAVIQASLYGTRGGAAMYNVGGSFYDFRADRFRGTSREQLVAPPDEWGGRTVVAWAEQLRDDRGFRPESEQLLRVAEALDAVYAAGLAHAAGAAVAREAARLPGPSSITPRG